MDRINSNDSLYLMLVGTYTNFDVLAHQPKSNEKGEGFYSFIFNNGTVTPINKIDCLNPAVLHYNPNNPDYVYAIAETIKDNGQINAYKLDIKPSITEDSINWDCNLSLLYGLNCNGKSTCYFSIDPNKENKLYRNNNDLGIAINYWNGSVDIFEFNHNNNYKLIQHIDHFDYNRSNNRQVVNREDHWKNRQVGPHAHSAHFFENQWVFITDLGHNCVYQYKYNPKSLNNVLEYECNIPLREGAGPRHMVIHPKKHVVYVSNELDGSVVVFQIDNTNKDECKPRLIPIQYESTLPENILEENPDLKNYVAEIKLSSDGNYLYTSNRGHDSIAIFKINNDGKLKMLKIVPTYGKCPRHFSITPDGNHLIIANQDSNELILFQRNQETGDIKLLSSNNKSLHVSAPCYILFYPINLNQLIQKYTSSPLLTISSSNNNNNKEELINDIDILSPSISSKSLSRLSLSPLLSKNHSLIFYSTIFLITIVCGIVFVNGKHL